MFLQLLFVSLICHMVENCYHTGSKHIVKRQQLPVQSKSCYEHIGCIRTDHEWYNRKYRPQNLEPLDRHTIRTTFIFITKELGERPLNFDTLTLKKDTMTLAGYQEKNPLVVLIHDFTSNGYTGWVKHLSSVLLTKKPVNVISVDWEAGAEPPFEQAIANARVVALEIIALFKSLKCDFNLSDEYVHIVGHGLGAHIAGYVGSSYPIKKITGLDPTGPFFEQMPPVVRLDPTDAHFVEVLHTDAFNSRSQGCKSIMGNIDFYLNGALLQPGCNQTTSYPVFTQVDRSHLREGTILPACSHKRAFKYYIEALDLADCEFTAIRCKNYEEFLMGICSSCNLDSGNTSNCATFGTDHTSVDPVTNNSYYLNTRAKPPYCVNSYQVTIHLDDNSKASAHKDGNFEIIMINGNGIMVTALSSNHRLPHRFNSGKSHTLIYYAPPPSMKSIIELRIKWLHKSNTICVFCTTTVYVKEVDIILLSAFKARSATLSRLCPAHGHTEIDNGSYSVFRKCPEGLTPEVTEKLPTSKSVAKQ